MISIIVAIARNYTIGSANSMPWHLPEDFRHFKQVTMGKAVIMGRKTYESIGRPLPGRRNIVITRNADLRIEGCEMATSLDEAIALCDPTEENFIIGGGEIYRQAMPIADKLYITHIDAEFEGDTRFPNIGPEWREISREEFPCGEKFPHPFAFVDYVRG